MDLSPVDWNTVSLGSIYLIIVIKSDPQATIANTLGRLNKDYDHCLVFISLLSITNTDSCF